MAREIINVGASPNDGEGDPIRTAFIKTNNNFGELYSRVQVEPPVVLTGSVGDTAGMTAYDEEYYYYCFANYDGTNVIWRQVPNAAQANVTTLSATGNITADYYFGDGGHLSNVIAGSGTELVNGNTNITTAYNGNANVTINGVSNVAVFTETGLDVVGIITGSTLSTTGNVDTGNLQTTGNISATGNINAAYNINIGGGIDSIGNIFSHATIRTIGTMSASGNTTFGNVYTGGSVSAVGNINTGANVVAVGNVIGNYLLGDGGFLSNVTVASNVAVTQIANGTTSMAVAGSAGNIAVTIAGVPNVVQFVPLGLQVAGNVNTANVYNTGKYVGVGNVTGSNLIATSNVIATGNVHGTYVNADLTMSATGNITGGNLRAIGNVTANGYFVGDGGYLSNIQTSYGNTNVATFLSSFGSNSISTTGNITVGTVGATDLDAVNLIVTNISSGDSTRVVVEDGLEVHGEIKSYELIVNSITSDDSTALTVYDDLSIHGDLDVIGDISSTGSLSIGGNVVGNVLPSANITYNLGSSTQRWKDLWLSNSTIYLGDSAISANASAIILTNPSGGQTVLTGASGSSEVTGAIVSATGDITGGNVLTGGVVSATGNVTGGNILTSGSMSATGNVTATYFTGTATQAQYADIAENYTADAAYEPGTVLEFGGSAEVTVAADETTRVAGIVSTHPAHLMNSMLTSEHIVALALLGRVPCKVRGNVAKGDMLISGGDGYARAKQNPIMGTVIGKALQASTGDHGIIEVVVGRL